MISFAKFDRTTWHKIVTKGSQCGMDKVSMAFFISLEYDSIATAGLCKQKYLFVLLHAHTYFNEAASDVMRLACVLHCAVTLLISVFLLRVLCLCQRPEEIKCKAKLGPQSLTLSSQEIRRWHSTTPNIKRQKAGSGAVSPPQEYCWDTKVPLLSSSVPSGVADPQPWVSWVIHLAPSQVLLPLLQESQQFVSWLWTQWTADGYYLKRTNTIRACIDSITLP